MRYQQPLLAGQETPIKIAGRMFLLEDTGAAASVDFKAERNGSSFFNADEQARGFRAVFERSFDGVRLTAPVDCVVSYFITTELINIDTTNGADVSVPDGVVVTNDIAHPVPVVFTGAVALTATSVSITPGSSVAIKEGDTITDIGSVAIGAGGAVQLLAAAVAAGKSLRFLNTGAVPVALGGAGVAFATAAVVVQPGQLWIEEEGAAAAWYGRTAGAAGAICVQRIV